MAIPVAPENFHQEKNLPFPHLTVIYGPKSHLVADRASVEKCLWPSGGEEFFPGRAGEGFPPKALEVGRNFKDQKLALKSVYSEIGISRA